MKKTVSLFLLCAGNGLRLGGKIPKAFYKFDKKELFLHSLSVFKKVKEIDNFYLVVDEKQINNFKTILKRENIKNVNLLLGSKISRHESLCSALKQANPSQDEIIITHDCARINITKEIIEKNIVIAKKYLFASTQIPLVDSVVKENKKGYVITPRKKMFLLQTPQTFVFSLWKNKKVKKQKVTDLFSYLHLAIKNENVVMGSVKNYKITFEQDLN